jgi:hypothetical protein
VASGAANADARIAQALTKAEVAIAHAGQADMTLRSTLARSGALERSHVQATTEILARVTSLTHTVDQLSTEIARLRTIESSTVWQATYVIRKFGDRAPKWLRNALRRLVAVA